MEEKDYTFKFFSLYLNLKNENKYDDFFNLEKDDLYNNLKINFEKEREFPIDEHIGIIEKLKISNEFFLGKYSFMPKQDCNYAENRNYSNLAVVNKKDVGTSCFTYFFVNFAKNQLIYIVRHNITGFRECFLQATNKSIKIDIQPEENWKKYLDENIKSISKVEIKELNEEETLNHLPSIKSLEGLQRHLVYDVSKFKVKGITTQNFIKTLDDCPTDDFSVLKVFAKDVKSDKEVVLDFIEKSIQKKITKKINNNDLDEKNLDKVIEIFKSVC